jgi:BolA family transcriptional regulator, general stress-responsive regulator
MLLAFPTRRREFRLLAIGLKGVDNNMSVAKEIKTKLTDAFAPDQLEVVNDSHRHAGHAGDDGTGETHFNVVIRAARFAPMNRIARHRAVHAALGPDLISRIHALALDIG